VDNISAMMAPYFCKYCY